MEKKRLVFTGGGTAGHVMPSVAVMERLADEFEIHYIGSHFGMEKDIISSIGGVKYHAVTTVKLVRSLSPKNLLIPFRLIKGINEAKRLLRKINPVCVFSKGGFVALPAAIGAKCPLICHESDMSVGLANKLVRKKAKYFCTSFSETAEKYPNGVYTGLPLRKSLFVPKKISASSRKTLLIMGGSQGAAAINKCVESSFSELTARYNIIHLTGKNKQTSLRHNAYEQMEFCADMGKLYARTDLCLSRGGSTALFELAALKIPSVIVPLPKGVSRGDQIKNAEYFTTKGLCRVIQECDLSTATLMDALSSCDSIKFGDKLPNAAEAIAALIKSI